MAVEGAEEVQHTIVSADLERLVRMFMFEHICRMGLGFHNGKKAGEVVEVLDRTGNAVDLLIETFMFTLAPALMQAALVCAVFWHVSSPGVAACVLGDVAAFSIYSCYSMWVSIKLWRRGWRAGDAVRSREVESLRLYETVRSHARTGAEVATYDGMRERRRSGAL